VITSTANPRVKAALALRKRRERDRTGRFLIEGRRELGRALAAGVEVEVVLACPALLARAASEPDEAEADPARGTEAAGDPDTRDRAQTTGDPDLPHRAQAAGDRGVAGRAGATGATGARGAGAAGEADVLGRAEAAGARAVEVAEAVFARLS
jgi:RNA methyltransferase, TrmH family